MKSIFFAIKGPKNISQSLVGRPYERNQWSSLFNSYNPIKVANKAWFLLSLITILRIFPTQLYLFYLFYCFSILTGMDWMIFNHSLFKFQRILFCFDTIATYEVQPLAYSNPSIKNQTTILSFGTARTYPKTKSMYCIGEVNCLAPS